MSDLVTIFCEIDDFCNQIEKTQKKRLLSGVGKGKRERHFKLSAGEIMTILVWYHQSGFKTFKDYYIKHVLRHMSVDFPDLVSYSRFIELKKMVISHLALFSQKILSKNTGISFIDSYKLSVSHIKRKFNHKTLKGIAQQGKTSIDWFFGMKLHVICNEKGGIVNFSLTSGNVADNNTKNLLKLTQRTTGKLFGDKGYLVRSEIRRKLKERGISLITKIKKNMKNKFLLFEDKLLLKKRGIIESVGNILKNCIGLEHSRHRAPWAFLLHVLSSLIAYQYLPKKPHLKKWNSPLHHLASSTLP